MKNEMKDIVLRSVKAGNYRVYADISFYSSWNQDQFDADAKFYTMKNMTLFFYYFVKFSVVFFLTINCCVYFVILIIIDEFCFC